MIEAENVRWALSRRLEFLERCLFWDGRVNRSDLTERFEISVPQASADLSKYQQIAPANMQYDKRAKTYLSSLSFAPVFGTPSADQFLKSLSTDRLSGLSEHLSTAIVPEIKRKVDAEILRTILRGIRERTSVLVQYQSMSSEDHSWRSLEPHSLGFDGARWHVRAFCDRNRDFRDFVLSRIFEIRESEPSLVPVSLDIAWSTRVTVRLKANPHLTRSMKQAVEREYEMAGGIIELDVPVCLSFYLLNAYSPHDAQSVAEPARYQVVISNPREIRAAMARAERKTSRGLQAFWLEIGKEADHRGQ